MEAHKNKIESLCVPEESSVITPPVEAKQLQPEWIRKLALVDKNHLHTNDNGQTIKRCIPVLDALNLINFPFMTKARDGKCVFKKGASMAQVIPFRRDGMDLSGSIRAESPQEWNRRKQIDRNIQSGSG